MSEAVDNLRYKARRCRELSRGLDEESRISLLRLADAYDAEADASEAGATKPEPPPDPRNEPPLRK